MVNGGVGASVSTQSTGPSVVNGGVGASVSTQSTGFSVVNDGVGASVSLLPHRVPTSQTGVLGDSH